MSIDRTDSGGKGPQQSRNDRDRPPVAIIGGPTASGKSALAIALARRTDGTVINADSAQVYRDLAILSARPGDAEMGDIPHRLFGHIDGSEDYSAARWANEAKREIAAAHAAGRVPILVGGTGLYLRTLIDGIAPVPDIDPVIRSAVRALSVEQAFAALSEEDSKASHRLNSGDTARVARALEVVRSTGRTLSDWQAHKVGAIGDDVTICAALLLPPRPWLFERCDRRFGQMIDAGAIEEVKALLSRDLADDRPVMRAIGVRQIRALLDGTYDRKTAIAQATLATRQYAKRQYTWFRNQPPKAWDRIDTLPDLALIERLADTMAKCVSPLALREPPRPCHDARQ